MEAILIALLEEAALAELKILIPEVGELVVAAIAALIVRVRANNPTVAKPVQDASQLAMDVVRRMETIDWGAFLSKDEQSKAKAAAALNDLLGQSVEHGIVLAQNDAEMLIRATIEILRTKLAAVVQGAETERGSSLVGMRRGGVRFGYGWRPDVPDHRDALFAEHVVDAKPLPPSVDLRPLCSPVFDQGPLGSCTANAITGMVEALMKKDRGHSLRLSRLFVYYNERALEHTASQDAGAAIRDGMKTIAADGICFEVNWPYDIRRFAVKPDFGCYTQAAQYQATSYLRLDPTNVGQLQRCLADGYAFVGGLTLYASFESDVVAKTGVVPVPGRLEKMAGGHALCFVGYDAARRAFLVRNSWSEHWGIGGYCWIPFDYVTNGDLASDFWTLRTGENI